VCKGGRAIGEHQEGHKPLEWVDEGTLMLRRYGMGDRCGMR
jgi:hypothetical protein